MDSPHILTRSQKKQLGDTEVSNNILPNEDNKLPSGDKTVENPIKKLLLEESLKSHEVQSPAKRLQPSRLSKNPVTPSKITDIKANIQTDQSTTLSQNKIVENNDEPSKNIPKKIISLWKPCDSPKVHKLSTIHENGKENVSLEDEGSLRVESSTLITPIREDRRSSMRIRRRSSSTSPTRGISSQPRIMTRRSMRSLSESRTFPDSPSIEESTKIPLKSCNKSDNSNIKNLKSNEEEPSTNTSNVTNEDDSPKSFTKVTPEQKTLPNENVSNLEPLKTIQENTTKNSPNVTAKDTSPKPSTKVTAEQKTLPNMNIGNLENLKTIQEDPTTNTSNVTTKDETSKPPTKVIADHNVTAKDTSPKPSTIVTAKEKTLPNVNVDNLGNQKTIQEDPITNTPNVIPKDTSPKPSNIVTTEQKTLPNVNIDNLQNQKTIQEDSTANTPNVIAKDTSPKPSNIVTTERKKLPNVNIDNLQNQKTIQEDSTANTSNVTVKDKSPKPSTKVTADHNVTAKDKSPKPSTKVTVDQKTLLNVNVDNLENQKTIQKDSTANTSNVTVKDKSPKPSTKVTADHNVTAKDKSPKPSTNVTAEQKTLLNVIVDNLENQKTIQEDPTANTSNVTAKDKTPKPSTNVTAEQKTLPNVNFDNLENQKTIQEDPTANTSNVTAKDKTLKPSTNVTAEQKTLLNVNVDNLENQKTIQEDPTTNTCNVTAKDKTPKPSTNVTAEQKTLLNVNVDNLENQKTIQEDPTTNTCNVAAKDKSSKPSTIVTAEEKTLPNVNVDNLENQKTIQEDPITNTPNVIAKDTSPKPSNIVTTEQKTLPNVNIDNLQNQKTIQEDPTTNTSNVTAKDRSPKPSTKVTVDQKTPPNVNVKKSIEMKELKIILTPVCNDVKLYKTTESLSSKDRKIVENSNGGLKKHSDNDNNVKKVSPKNKSEKVEEIIQIMSVTTTSCDNTVAENLSSKDKKVFENISSEMLKKHSDNENNTNICPKQIQSNSEETIQKEVLTSSCNSSANKGQKIPPNVNVKKTVVSTDNNEPSIVLEESDEQTEKCENKKPATEKKVQVKTSVNLLSTDNLKNIKTIQNERNKLDKPIEKSMQDLLKEHVIKSKTPLSPNSGSEKLQKELTSSNTTKDKLNSNLLVETKTPQTVEKFVKSSKEIKLVSKPVVCNEKQSDKIDITDKGNENIQKQSKSNDDHTIIKANYTKLDDSNKKNDDSSKTSLVKKKLVTTESKTLTNSKNVSNKVDIQDKTKVNIVQPIHKKEISNICSKEGNKIIMNENGNECSKHEGKVDEKLENDEEGDNKYFKNQDNVNKLFSSVGKKGVESIIYKENFQKTTLEPSEIVNENLNKKETLDSKVASSIGVIDYFNSSQKVDSVFGTAQVSVSESSENSKVSIVQLESSVYETQTNNVDYLGTHKFFCELLEDSPKKDVHNINETKVSNKEIKALSSIIKEQFGTEDLEQSGKQENLKKSSEEVKVDENESSSDSDSNVAHLDTIEETVENDLTKNDFKSIKSDEVDVEHNKKKLVNMSENSFGMNMKTILYEYSHDADVNTNKQNEDTKNKKRRNRRTRKNKVSLQAQKQNDEKVEASVETCSVILRVKNDINSSEENVAVFDNKTSKSVKRSYGELEEYDNMNNVNIQQQEKKQINKKSKKNKAAKHTDDIMKIKNETAQEVKNVCSHEKSIPESIISNKRLHDESDVDKQDKKKIKMVKSQENPQSNLSQVTQNSEKISTPRTQRDYRKVMIKFKKTLKNIDFTELLELLTIPNKNEHVKSLNLNQNDLRKLKAKILQSTEYNKFASTITKKKITSDTKLSAKQKNDAIYKFNMNKPNVIENFNQKKSDSKSYIESEKFKSSKRMNNEPELLNTGQNNVKLSKKKKRNRSKSKKNIVSSTIEPVSMKSINFNSKAEMNKGNQLENRQFQEKPKQNKPEFGKVIDQPTASSKGKLINQKQEFNQQVKKWKPKIEENIQLRIDKESNKGSLAMKRENVSVLKYSGKAVGKKLKDEGAQSKVESEPKQIPIKQRENISQNMKIQKKKNNKVAVQPTILKTAGCLFKVEKSANSNTTSDQRKTNVKDIKEPSGFKVHTVKGGNVFNTEKTILQSNENSEDFRNSKEYKAGLKQMKKNIDTHIENNMFTFFKKPKKGGTSEKRKGPNDDGQTQKKTGIKRLPSELLEALTNEPLEKKKKDVETAESVKTSKKKKKLKLKSAILEESYIPLTTDGATQFVVARLDKEAPLTSAQQAANFRNNQLYGPFNRRVSAKQLHSMKQKYKANNKE